MAITRTQGKRRGRKKTLLMVQNTQTQSPMTSLAARMGLVNLTETYLVDFDVVGRNIAGFVVESSI